MTWLGRYGLGARQLTLSCQTRSADIQALFSHICSFILVLGDSHKHRWSHLPLLAVDAGIQLA